MPPVGCRRPGVSRYPARYPAQAIRFAVCGIRETLTFLGFSTSRADRIRTCDLLVPNQAVFSDPYTLPLIQSHWLEDTSSGLSIGPNVWSGNPQVEKQQGFRSKTIPRDVTSPAARIGRIRLVFDGRPGHQDAATGPRQTPAAPDSTEAPAEQPPQWPTLWSRTYRLGGRPPRRPGIPADPAGGLPRSWSAPGLTLNGHPVSVSLQNGRLSARPGLPYHHAISHF